MQLFGGVAEEPEQLRIRRLTEKTDKPVVNFAVLQSVEDYVNKSGKFRTNCYSFDIPGRDSGGGNALYIPNCQKQRFDFGPVLNDWRGHGVFTPPETGKRWAMTDFVLFRERFHDIHCPRPCEGYRNKRIVALFKKFWPHTPSSGKWTRKEIATVVVVPTVLVLLGVLGGWLTPEGRRLLHLDKPQPDTQTSSPSPPLTKPQTDSAPPQPTPKKSGRGTAVGAGTSVKGNNNVTGNGNVSGSIVNNGGVINNPTINNAAPQKVGSFELTEEKRSGFLKLLSAQTAPRDTLRIGCTSWSEASCVAAGTFLLLFSQAGWQIEDNKVFRLEPQIPIVGVAIVTRTPSDEPKEPLPPHLGRWRLMDESHKTIYWAFHSLSIPVNAGSDESLKDGTLGIYFGPEPK
jgi:hypothetical protein